MLNKFIVIKWLTVVSIVLPSSLNLVVTSDNPLVVYINKSYNLANSGDFPQTPTFVHPVPLHHVPNQFYQEYPLTHL